MKSAFFVLSLAATQGCGGTGGADSHDGSGDCAWDCPCNANADCEIGLTCQQGTCQPPSSGERPPAQTALALSAVGVRAALATSRGAHAAGEAHGIGGAATEIVVGHALEGRRRHAHPDCEELNLCTVEGTCDVSSDGARFLDCTITYPTANVRVVVDGTIVVEGASHTFDLDAESGFMSADQFYPLLPFAMAGTVEISETRLHGFVDIALDEGWIAVEFDGGALSDGSPTGGVARIWWEITDAGKTSVGEDEIAYGPSCGDFSDTP
mgnify:CR=1 FL=1